MVEEVRIRLQELGAVAAGCDDTLTSGKCHIRDFRATSQTSTVRDFLSCTSMREITQWVMLPGTASRAHQRHGSTRHTDPRVRCA
jgi:hypothetical protein